MNVRFGFSLLLLLAAAPGAASAQDSLVDFEFLLGKWEGELQYLDYRDDETFISLPATMQCEPNETGSALVLAYSYGEPDGRRVDGREVLRLGRDGGEIFFDGRWRVEAASLDSAAERYEVLLVGTGLDNERSAAFRKTILREGTELSITKEVRYEDEDDFFLRNRHVFARADGP